MKPLRIDLNYSIVVAALLVDVPLAIGAFVVAHGEPSPPGWFFRWLPGIGLGIIGLLGNARVADAAAKPGLPRWLRLVLGSSWGLSFACILWVLPLYLMAAAGHQSIEATVSARLPGVAADLVGLIAWSWYLATVALVHMTVPALLVISGYERGQVAEALKRADVAMMARDTTPTSQKILSALANGGEATVKELAELVGCTEATARSNADKLERSGALAHVTGAVPKAYRIA